MHTARPMLKSVAALALCAAAALLLPATLPAEPSAAITPAAPPVAPPASLPTLTTDIPAQSLAQALENFAHQTGIEYASVAGVVTNQQTRGAPAGLAPDEALKRLLEGTGLRHQFLNTRFVRIVAETRGTDTPLPPLEEVIILAHRIPRPFVAPASAAEQRTLDAANADLEARIEREHLLYGDPRLDQYVQSVAERLLAVDQTDASSVHVRIVKGVDANAFALSNGSIYLTTALMATLDDEAQLSAVLGHELTHYINCDALRGLRQENHKRIFALTAGTLVDFMFGMVSAHYGSYSNQAVIKPETVEVWVRASSSGYSRDLEREADDGGIRRMIAAGYDPSGALAALEHLAEQTVEKPGGTTPKYASHPRVEQRLASYRDLLAGDMARAAGAGELRREEYRARLGPLPLDAVSLMVDAGVVERADRILTLEMATADSGRAEFLRGEIYRKRVPQTDATVQSALAAYERAVTLDAALVTAYRQAGLLHRLRGESEAAMLAFQTYLERAPAAVDAAIVQLYLEELRSAAPLATATPAQ
jgi:Zn-dependent protease with chaperone function